MFPPTLKWCAPENIDIDVDSPTEEDIFSTLAPVYSPRGSIMGAK
jgi:hypothetical protein